MMPVADQSHERIWRQMLRWLVAEVPDRMTVTLSPDRAAPGEAVRVTAQVHDAAFKKLNDARVQAEVISPTGEVTSVTMPWSVAADGEYAATFPALLAGMYEVRVSADRVGEPTSVSQASYVEVSPSTSEYFEAGMRAPLLRRIAAETGGRFYTASLIGNMAEDIAYTGRGLVAQEERDLWDMPIILLGILLLLGGEWAYRRYRGLA